MQGLNEIEWDCVSWLVVGGRVLCNRKRPLESEMAHGVCQGEGTLDSFQRYSDME